MKLKHKDINKRPLLDYLPIPHMCELITYSDIRISLNLFNDK